MNKSIQRVDNEETKRIHSVDKEYTQSRQRGDNEVTKSIHRVDNEETTR